MVAHLASVAAALILWLQQLNVTIIFALLSLVTPHAGVMQLKSEPAPAQACQLKRNLFALSKQLSSGSTRRHER